MVLDESMRLFPPAWVFERRAIGDDEVMGYRIPAGMNLGFTPYVTHRMPEFWENPDAFDPERMSPERMEKRPRFAFMPFGGGPRQCIGNTFALQEMHLILPMLLQRYSFKLDPAFPVEREPVVSLRPKGGLRMHFVPVK
jgi:cytochrome P450